MIDIREANRYRFSRAKRLWMCANATKFLSFVLSGIVVFLSWPEPIAPYLVFVLGLAAELFQWRSDFNKGQSEGLLRKLDVCDSFGMGISVSDERDIVAFLPRRLRDRFTVEVRRDAYFDSPKDQGPERSFDNLSQSAWLTREQTRVMVAICVLLIVAMVGGALAALVFASVEAEQASTRSGVSRVVTAWLMLIFSLGVFRNLWGYHRLHERADASYRTSEHALASGPTREDAIKQWYEYQIGRAMGPLLPEWLWRWKKKDLEDVWRRTRGKT
jgi:hypothetical protein